MKRTILLILCAALALASGADSQTPGERRMGESVVKLDSNLVLIPAKNRNPLGLRLEENTSRPFSGYLSTYAEHFIGLERYELSKFECAMSGAGMGLTYGLFLGAAGMTFAGMDEKAAWYVAGAAALSGALFGASKADDPAFRVRLRWEPTR
jgi:hypothetical protein